MRKPEFQRILITVLTYPNPSKKYQETVCTAGITEDGKWVRLYPLPLRSLPSNQQFRKWQWVEMETMPTRRDKRPESRCPLLDTIVMKEKLTSDTDRELRRKLVDNLPHRSLAGWQSAFEENKTSLGVLVPKRVLDIEHERVKGDWTEEQKTSLSQMNLFAGAPKTLHKIPYVFRYVIEDEDDTVYRLPIGDWELGMLFLKMREKHGELVAIQKVKQKYLDEICASDKDTRFFIGTIKLLNQWMIVGTFWPPKMKAEIDGQGTLFDDES